MRGRRKIWDFLQLFSKFEILWLGGAGDARRSRRQTDRTMNDKGVSLSD